MIVIANPPFRFSNKITATVINNVDFIEYVNLMPVSKYRGKKIYQHVIPNSVQKVQWTGDALTNPQIAELTKKRNESVIEAEFNSWCYDKKFAKYYLANMNRQLTFDYISEGTKIKKVGKVNPQTCFVIGRRALTDGVHTTEDCLDYKWNVQKQQVSLCCNGFSGPEAPLRVFIFKFSTEAEMNNFTKFWYLKGKKGLMNKLIKGTGKQGGSIRDIIPKLDWTKEWTDEEILKDYGYTDEEIKELLK